MKSVKDRLAVCMSRLGTETAFEVMKKAQDIERKKKVKVIHLEIGQPDFVAHEIIRKATKLSLDEGDTGYAPSPGILDLREALAKRISDSRNIKVSPDEVVVTAGGKPIIGFAIWSLVNPGDEVIYPNPGYPIYKSMINFVGAKAVPIPLIEENDFRMDISKMKRLVTDRTKLIIINSPQNPTGGVLTAEDLKTIAEIAIENDIMVLSDEVYSEIIYDTPFTSIASLPGMKERTIILEAFSKTYAMTGYRLGYGVMDKDLAWWFARLNTNVYSCLPIFTQKGGLAAIKAEGPEIENSVKTMIAQFIIRRDVLVSGINQIPKLTCRLPGGAFYAFINIKETGLSAKEVEERLLGEAFVATLAGTSFGEFGEGYIRISYANSLDNIKEGLKRIREWVRKL